MSQKEDSISFTCMHAICEESTRIRRLVYGCFCFLIRNWNNGAARAYTFMAFLDFYFR
jgi:hypothetical protein